MNLYVWSVEWEYDQFAPPPLYLAMGAVSLPSDIYPVKSLHYPVQFSPAVMNIHFTAVLPRGK